MTAVPASTRLTRRGPSTAALARLVLAGIAVYVAADVLLAFLRPGYSLLRNPESDYGHGPWRWIMDANFLIRCVLSLAYAACLARAERPGRRTRTGVVLLVLWALCSGLLAFFPDDLHDGPRTTSGAVHGGLVAIGFTALTIAAIVLSTASFADPARRRTARVLLALAIAGAVAYVLFGITLGGSTVGLWERVYLGLELLWIAVAAVTLLRAGPTRSHT